MSEQQGSCRAKALKSAKISYGGGAISCSVRNLTEAVARLDVESWLVIPMGFPLLVLFDGMCRPCRVIWRSGNRIGVRLGAGAS